MSQPITVQTKVCIHCHKPGELVVDAAGFARWRQGEFVQVAFPEMPAELREQLISGIHPQCWIELFGQEDEE